MTTKRATTKPISKRQADALWQQLRDHLVNAEKVLGEIIERQAWKAQGYNTFTEAWKANHMSDITLASELRPHVIYAMLDEGINVDVIAAQVKGIAGQSVKEVARQRSNGVPASEVSVVRRHLRKKPTERSMLHIEIGPDKMRLYTKIAHEHKTTVEAVALQAITERFIILGAS